MKNSINFILILAVMLLLFAGSMELLQWIKRGSSPKPNANIVGLGVQPPRPSEVMPTETIKPQTVNPPQQAVQQEFQKQMRKEVPFTVTFEIKNSENHASVPDLENGFFKTLTKSPVKIATPGQIQEFIEAGFVVYSEAQSIDPKNGWHVSAELQKQGAEKWILNYQIQQGFGSSAVIKRKNELSFPRTNPLPGHKIFYTDKQMGEIMAVWVIEEIGTEFTKLKAQQLKVGEEQKAD